MVKDVELLGELVSRLDRNRIGYRVVGGVARDAYLGLRTGRIRDVDLLVTSLPKGFNEERISQLVPGLKIDLYINNSIAVAENTARIKTLGGVFELDPLLFEPRTVPFCGVNLVTVDARTLLHTYSVVGAMRAKDLHTVLDLARSLKHQGAQSFDEKNFRIGMLYLERKVKRKNTFDYGGK
ncbi:hypothetical protein HY440_01730 [Candidatus Microgenomates bacterium]|nr:hypothetical protein [Candidatus Microgenomates bacterium]